jgi:hypothetical protein
MNKAGTDTGAGWDGEAIADKVKKAVEAKTAKDSSQTQAEGD